MEKIHLTAQEGQNIFFTSDLHIGHRNILRFCNRDRTFEDVKTMDAGLISRWNSVVKEGDVVFNCGDFLWFPGTHEHGRIFKKLNGTHYIIPGNHDDAEKMRSAVEKYHLQDKVHICSDVVTLYLEGFPGQRTKIQEIILCHYPLLTWSHSNQRTLHLFGHIHSLDIHEMKEWEVPMQFRPNMLDVGCDSHFYTPITLEKVYEELEELGLKTEGVSNWGLLLDRGSAGPDQPQENDH